MRDRDVWQLAHALLDAGQTAVLLLVLESEGSSPGRQGFKMVVGPDGQLAGSVGGGIMEHKLVEKARDMLRKGESEPFIKRQIHSKSARANQSGMICSGEQRLVLIPLQVSELPVIASILQAMDASSPGTIRVDRGGLQFDAAPAERPYAFQYTSDDAWRYAEKIGYKDTVHIIGGGHVGLATSRIFAQLDFRVVVYDDRPGLNTMATNKWAHERIVTPYEGLADYIPEGPQHFVVVMTFGYRGDDVAVRALLGRSYAYFGMMGSKAKVAQLIDGLKADGFAARDIAALRTPIGLPINSRTPAEIGISVAAEVIAVRNGAQLH